MNPFSKLLAWAAKNERPLGAGLFALGFITDLFTFGFLPVGVVNLFFITYLSLAALCVFGTHLISVYRERDVWWRKLLSVLCPLGAQYAIGGLLSGFVVFYAKSSVVAVSWPFLLLLLLVYGGNEYFREHKEKLVFQSVLFFFALYGYTIFALPLYLGMMGPWIFIGSTLVAMVLFGTFLFLLKLVNAVRYKESRKPVIAFSLGLIVVINGAYFAGYIPPIPLVLSHAEIYHELSRESGAYMVRTDEPKPWWNPFARTVEHVPGTPLYVFSSVKAPSAFATSITHEWEYYVEGEGWERRSRVSFPITGGRQEGYRGYSVSENPAEGKWRVTIATGGQVIGRLTFNVKEVPSVVLSHSERL
jgi:hypothetical protein